MPRKKTKEETLKLRPFLGDNEIAERISQAVGIDKNKIMAMALSAGLRAIKENGYRYEAPLALKVLYHGEAPSDPDARRDITPAEQAALNEPPAPYGKKKSAKVLKLPGQNKDNQ